MYSSGLPMVLLLMMCTVYSSRGWSGLAGFTASAIVAPAVSGSHVLKIYGYSRTKGLGNGNPIESKTFAIGGHRWYINYYPDGLLPGDADWISILICLHYDDTPSEVKATYRISLLDQDGNPVPSYSFDSPEKCDFKIWSWGSAKLIKRKDLEKSAYLKNDVFSVRCDLTVNKDIYTKHIVPVTSLRNVKKDISNASTLNY